MKRYHIILLLIVLLVAGCKDDRQAVDSSERAEFNWLHIEQSHNIATLKGGDVIFKIDRDNNRADASTLLPSDVGKLIATFSLTNGKAYVEGVLQQSGTTVNDFSSPVEYVLVNDNGERHSVTVTLTQFTGLPVVSINTQRSVGVVNREDWIEATVSISCCEESVQLPSTQVAIRGRGNTTWGYPKKPYALKFPQRTSVLGMPKQKRWVLLANYMDRTLLRNRMAFRVAQNTSLAWTPRSEFVELFLNGKHLGNYLLCEQIRVDKNRVDIEELTAADSTADLVSGGYLLEFDVNFDEPYKFHSALFDLPVMVKSPDSDVINTAQQEYIEGYINRVEELICSDDLTTTRQYSRLIDCQSYVDWWIVHEVCRNFEPGHPKSCFMHKSRNGLLTSGPVWDFDWHTFAPSTSMSVKKSLWYGKLFNDPQFVALVKERWTTLKPILEGLADTLYSEQELLTRSEQLNIAMWPMTVTINEDSDLSFPDAVRKMHDTYLSRIEWLDGQIAKF